MEFLKKKVKKERRRRRKLRKHKNRALEGEGKVAPEEYDSKAQEALKGEIMMFSGCADSQTSADVHDVASFGLPDAEGAGGACTHALLKSISEGAESYVDILKEMRQILKTKRFTQLPQLSASRRIDLRQSFQPKQSNEGRTKALLIGINYKGTRAELRGCINDVHRMRQYLLTQSFPPQETIILTDDNAQMMPSRANILRYIDWLVSGTQRGDSLFFHFSGHGAQQEDLDGDEEDGYDETIVPCDFKRAGQITDDELWKRLVAPLPEGSRLTSIMDCCHSGTGLDLAFTYTQSRGWTVDDNPAHAAADIQMLSGCEDAQCSADAATSSGIHGGAMTSAFLQVIKDNPMPLYPDLMSALHRELRRKGFNQRPQLSSSQRFDLNDRVFSLTDGFIPNSNSTLGRIIHPQQGRRRRRRRKRRPGALGGFNAMFAAGAGGLLLGSMLS
mmetsp:Transcript_23061/g.29851  ORF Transcript_23061/g.29851 Transcript_23061/m.29851 type:complete len:445 (-) Transcript_23061:378-1712(-)